MDDRCRHGIYPYAVPDGAMDAHQATTIDEGGGTFAGPEDMESHPRGWAVNVRVMAAIGQSGTADEELCELYVDNAWWGDEIAPTREQIEKSGGRSMSCIPSCPHGLRR